MTLEDDFLKSLSPEQLIILMRGMFTPEQNVQIINDIFARLPEPLQQAHRDRLKKDD